MIVRVANQGDMPIVHMMGHDAWGEGKPAHEHLDLCLASPKYAKGRWFVLEDQGEVKSSLICYRDAFSLPLGAVGIGSVATAQVHQRKGSAAALISDVISRFSEDASVNAFFLYSDVAPAIYEKLGFVKLFPEQQRHKSSVAMVHALKGSFHSLTSGNFKAPDYF